MRDWIGEHRQLRAMLTLETARIFLSTKNGATNIGEISFRQRLN